jgi:hypothetical protein
MLIDHGRKAVSLWSKVGAGTFNQPAAAAGTPEERRPTYDLDLATLHVSIYDALAAVTRTHQPFMATLPAHGATAM